MGTKRFEVSAFIQRAALLCAQGVVCVSEMQTFRGTGISHVTDQGAGLLIESKPISLNFSILNG